MKMNKLMAALVMAMGVASFGANAASGGAGKVTFTGSIVDAPCSITPGTSEQEVKLGQVSQGVLKDQGSSVPSKFDIQLQNCDVSAVGKTVSITFAGTAAGTTGGDANLLGITGAKGAGVAITDGAGTLIALGQKTGLRKMTQGDNTLNFSAYLKGLAASSAVEPGQFSSVADFVLDYE